MPDDVAEEKVKALQSLGADVERVRPASIVDKKQVSKFSQITKSHLLITSPVCRKAIFGFQKSFLIFNSPRISQD